MKLIRAFANVTRKQAKENKTAIYIFTDNGDRTSGKQRVPDESEYAKRFGKTGLMHPLSKTSAILRGLDNAFPITTQKHYVLSPNQSKVNWEDSDFEEFKKVIDDDIEHIKEACVRLKPANIIFPCYGILNSKIPNITFYRTPKLYNYIIEKEIELRDFEI